MAPENSDKTIRITLDDLANVAAPDIVAPATSAPAGGKVYGSINEPADPQTKKKKKKAAFFCRRGFIWVRRDWLAR